MADTNPLSGLPLESWQILVTGPAGRETVVDTRSGAALEPWISRVDIPIGDDVAITSFVDNGAAGGTYDGNPQQLPELVTTGRPAGAPIALVAGLVWFGGKLLERSP